MINDTTARNSLIYTQTNEIALNECEKIEKVRSRLYSLGLIGINVNGMGFGNISLRYKKKNSFIITSNKTGELPKLSPNYYSLVKKVDFRKFCIYALGPSKPDEKAIIHSIVYNLNLNINAIIYIDNEMIWDYMMENDYLCTNDTICENSILSKNINDMYKNVNPFLNNAFLIKGYYKGIVSFGKSLKDAEKTIYEIINNIIKNR